MPPIPITARMRVILAAAYFWHMIHLAVVLYASPLYWRQPYHTSALTGRAWLDELIVGHPNRIKSELGMRVHVFLTLVAQLQALTSLKDSRFVRVDEQVAIFLYTCVTGLSIRHVGERFQHSNETISKYFRRVLIAIASPPFYTRYVHLPSVNDPIPELIRSNPKFFPFFQDAIGSMDGTHINSCPSAEDRHASRNRKGGVSMNCLACCSQDMLFFYVLSGWEGSMSDAALYLDARLHDLAVPPGKFYLADAGFGSCDATLVPYRGVRYHLAEWGRANIRPATREELFNLRHASARNVVECIFGVLKGKWAILVRAPEYDMGVQARIPPAMAALHNFILKHDSEEWDDILDMKMEDPAPGTHGPNQDRFGHLAEGPTDPMEKARSEARRDRIAQAMWVSYQELLRERGEELDE